MIGKMEISIETIATETIQIRADVIGKITMMVRLRKIETIEISTARKIIGIGESH